VKELIAASNVVAILGNVSQGLAGRLSITFYTEVDQLLPFDDYTMKDRTRGSIFQTGLASGSASGPGNLVSPVGVPNMSV